MWLKPIICNHFYPLAKANGNELADGTKTIQCQIIAVPFMGRINKALPLALAKQTFELQIAFMFCYNYYD